LHQKILRSGYNNDDPMAFNFVDRIHETRPRLWRKANGKWRLPYLSGGGVVVPEPFVVAPLPLVVLLVPDPVVVAVPLLSVS
jgi:hypothetical protein